MKKDHFEYKFAGIPTFMRSEYVTADELDAYDVGVLGVPVDHGVSYREGARKAPRAIREYSHWDRVDGRKYYNFDNGSEIESRDLKIADVGDVNIFTGDAEKTNIEIIKAVRSIRKKTFPVVIGGDHSITYASFRGCNEALSDDQKPMGILHFDAHTDVEKEYINLPRVWHGNPFRVLIEEGHVKGENMVTIGPRGLVPVEWMEFIHEQQITVHSTPDIRRLGLEEVISRVKKHLRERCRSVYISFDIDCIDPIDAPGTGTPLSGGLRAQEAIQFLRSLSDLPVVGFDLTEVNPDFDISGRTAITACDLLWNYLSFGYHNTLQK